MIGFLKPEAHKPELPPQQIDPTYRRLRWQVFMGIFFGYAAYYFVRKNFTLAMPGLIDSGAYTKEDLGYALSSISIAYVLSPTILSLGLNKKDCGLMV